MTSTIDKAIRLSYKTNTNWYAPEHAIRTTWHENPHMYDGEPEMLLADTLVNDEKWLSEFIGEIDFDDYGELECDYLSCSGRTFQFRTYDYECCGGLIHQHTYFERYEAIFESTLSDDDAYDIAYTLITRNDNAAASVARKAIAENYSDTPVETSPAGYCDYDYYYDE